MFPPAAAPRALLDLLPWALAWVAASASPAWGQPVRGLSLPQAFESAWARQPEAAALGARRSAAAASRDAAGRWTAEAPVLELAAQSDRLHGGAGRRDLAVGVSLPLWLPGERGRAGRLAEAEAAAIDARWAAARLRTAAQLREAWWAHQRAAVDEALARDRLAATRQLLDDVALRLRAGDLARADHVQARAAVVLAEAAVAEASAGHAAARWVLQALLGRGPEGVGDLADPQAEPLPPPEEPAPLGREGPARAGAPAAAPDHPALVALQAQAAVSRRAAELAAVQTRANPELSLATVRERTGAGEPGQGSLSLSLRIPFGGGGRAEARQALARAEALEAESELALARGRLQADVAGARARLAAARTQQQAAEQRAMLTREVRGFVDKAFRLGEADLPARLRVELEAAEAARQAARAGIDTAAAVSTLRQVLGLLPE